MSSFERADAIALLECLGSPDDAEVLAAARALHARIAAAGLTWDDVLALDLEAGIDDRLAEADDPDAEPGLADEDGEAAPPATKAEDLALIDAVLAFALTPETRDELKAFKGDIADGEFTAMDRKYCRDLLRRLEARGGR